MDNSKADGFSQVAPPTDVKEVLENEIKEYHFHIYFLQNDAKASQAALQLRDAVLRLRRDGAFVAVPLFRVNTSPIGPHPVGSYEVWCPRESFASVFSYMALHHGELSVLVHPLTREERKDHDVRKAWIGPPFPLYLDSLNVNLSNVPSQYHSLKLGYSSEATGPSIEERKTAGAAIEQTLRGEKEAAPAPQD
ncbi:hypothetical protein FRB99_008073 [Tulasnella sp. 403]|nr:hypothetical protein FRB99_008073 [Tulasnella sp. 403]